MKELKILTIDDLEVILSNSILHFSQRIAEFYAEIERRDYLDMYEYFSMFTWVDSIFGEIKNDTVYLVELRKKLLKQQSTLKNNTIENIYFKIATSLAFSKNAIKKNDIEGFFRYLLEAEKFKGSIVASQDPKLYTILLNDQTSKGGLTKAENHRKRTEDIKNHAINTYRDLNYRRKHGIKNIAEFCRHFCRIFNEGLHKTNPNIQDSELLKESSVRRWITPPKKN